MNIATEQKRKELLMYIEQEVITDPSIQGVVAIGSVAMGTARDDSDIDTEFFQRYPDQFSLISSSGWI